MSCRLLKRLMLALAFLVMQEAMAQSNENPKSFSATSNELIGLWSGEGEVIEFRSDGKCRYVGETYEYEISQGHLLIETSSGKIIFAYAIKSGRLILTAEGQQSVYTKMTSADQVKPVRRDARNPADLVGQWCYLKSSTGSYSGRCITLRADGTYLYREENSRSVQSESVAGGTSTGNSDSGTWYVAGDRLYYESPTEGNGSYKLERRNHPVNAQDPMIVLDDEPFVTTVSRPPWR